MKFTGKWLPDSADFRKECLKIAKDLTGFKRNPVYCRFINNDNRSLRVAIQFADRISRQSPGLWARMPAFSANDTIGLPTIHFFWGTCSSPGTLRFVKVLSDLERFGMINSIVEIGGGYGGQCFVAKTAFPHLEYTLIDIPESLAVAEAYLSALKIKATFRDCEWTIPECKYDLCISDFCLTEMDSAAIDFYMEAVVKHCKNGYFTGAFGGMTKYLERNLRDKFRTVEVRHEKPKTSKHENVIICALDNRNL